MLGVALADYLPANPGSRVARELARACRRYIHRFNGYSYDFIEGGEQNVMQRLSLFRFQTVFDVGANEGKWSTLAKMYFPNAKFHTFEISKATFEALTGNLVGPEFKNNNFGLSSDKTDLSYKDYGSGSGLNSIIPLTSVHDKNAPHEMRTARVETGDGYCLDHSVGFVDFLKVDVEGAEHLVLQGFHEMLKKNAVRAVQFEYGYNNGDSRFLMRDFFNFFDLYGYCVARIRKRKIQFTGFSYSMNDFESGPNYLAVRKGDQQVLEALTRPS
jgi:FkbM family methyltransferase